LKKEDLCIEESAREIGKIASWEVESEAKKGYSVKIYHSMLVRIHPSY
jgi:hypothetical protein